MVGIGTMFPPGNLKPFKQAHRNQTDPCILVFLLSSKAKSIFFFFLRHQKSHSDLLTTFCETEPADLNCCCLSGYALLQRLNRQIETICHLGFS